jgi:hypothetical protein
MTSCGAAVAVCLERDRVWCRRCGETSAVFDLLVWDGECYCLCDPWGTPLLIRSPSGRLEENPGVGELIKSW